MSPKCLILLDFDGVLVDSFDAAYETVKEVWPALPLSVEEYRACFEGNIYETFFEKYGDQRYEDKVFGRYIPKILQLPVVPGMREAIADLAASYRLVIISSTRTEPIRTWLEGHGIAGHIEDVLGEEAGKGKAEKMKTVLDRYGVSAEDCLFVTDTLGDIREASEAGIRSLAVTWGYHDEETLRKGNPAGIARSPEELISEIQRMV